MRSVSNDFQGKPKSGKSGRLQDLCRSVVQNVSRWLVDPFRRHQSDHRSIKELSALDDKLLRDIGLNRLQMINMAYLNMRENNGPVSPRNLHDNAIANDNRRKSKLERVAPSCSPIAEAA